MRGEQKNRDEGDGEDKRTCKAHFLRVFILFIPRIPVKYFKPINKDEKDGQDKRTCKAHFQQAFIPFIPCIPVK